MTQLGTQDQLARPTPELSGAESAPISLPSGAWRMLASGKTPPPLAKGLDHLWNSAAGYLYRARLSRRIFLRRAQGIVALEKDLRTLSEAHLKERLMELRTLFRLGRAQAQHLDRAFALVREVADRQLGERPYLVQVAAALALEAGCIVELATGEGKTLTATMPATVAGWRGRGCHIVTVNDYLAKRDAAWMEPIYRFCGVSVAHIANELGPEERRAAYLADVTYCTNKEVTADFLRDRLALGRQKNLAEVLLAQLGSASSSMNARRLVLRRLERAIVDEADSILVDEAVTPLIISGQAPNKEMVESYQQAAALAQHLATPAHYLVNRQYREVQLTPAGAAKLTEAAGGLGGLWAGRRRREELVVQALTARELFLRDKQYVVHDDKVVIVDEFTGRLMPDRTWREGLHQAVEAQEKLTITPIKDTLSRISFQRFFRLYPRLAGMTGTAQEAWPEFWRTYHLPVITIPTNKPCIRRYLPDRIFATAAAKWRGVVQEIQEVHATGRPILIGTRSVAASEHLSALLVAVGLEHQVLNAVRHEQEAQIVAGAGQPGRITVATNMAGRGTDIKLAKGIAELGGLHVLATERNESGRIDRQLFGRCARQGDPGSAAMFASLEDELLQRHASALGRWWVGRQRRGVADNTGALSDRWPRRLIRDAQNRAEYKARQQRSAVLRTDDWLDEFLGFAGKE